MLALAFGLGTRDTARNLVAGAYARKNFQPGMEVVLSDKPGTIEEVGAVSTRIRTADGKVVLAPNGQLTEMFIETTPLSEETA